MTAKITLRHGTAFLELLAEAFHDLTLAGADGYAPALDGVNLADAEIEIGEDYPAKLPTLTLRTADGRIARFDPGVFWWEIAIECPRCGEEEWSLSGECHCNCKVLPERDNPEGWRE